MRMQIDEVFSAMVVGRSEKAADVVAADWAALHEAQRSALGLPHALLAQLRAALEGDSDPFELRPDGGVHSPGGGAVRVGPCSVLALSEAVRLWPPQLSAGRGVPVDALNSGCDQEGLALLDPLADAVRHSCDATHRLGIFCPSGGRPVSVMWPIDEAAAAVDVSEVTRDHHEGRYMLDSPLLRAVGRCSRAWSACSSRGDDLTWSGGQCRALDATQRAGQRRGVGRARARLKVTDTDSYYVCLTDDSLISV